MLYVTLYDRGQILTSTLARDGSPRPLQVFAKDRALITADGFPSGAFTLNDRGAHELKGVPDPLHLYRNE
jgi:hypothetical protein